MPSLIVSEENTKRINQMMCQTVTWFDHAPYERTNRKLTATAFPLDFK